MYLIDELDKSMGVLDHLEWSADGHFLSVSTRSGCVHVLRVPRSSAEMLRARGWGSLCLQLGKPFTPFSLLTYGIIVLGLLVLCLCTLMDISPVDLVSFVTGIRM